MQANVLKSVLFATAVAAAGFAQAAEPTTVNPLEPLAYVGQPAQAAPTQNGAPYVDQSNPLSAAHQYAQGYREFSGTASTGDKVYRDSNNPLDPNYVRR